jgi:hypothetical protein
MWLPGLTPEGFVDVGVGIDKTGQQDLMVAVDDLGRAIGSWMVTVGSSAGSSGRCSSRASLRP